MLSGLVLAAGVGSRLRPHTDSLPKTLVPLGDGTTVLDRTLGNFAANGIERAAIVVGHCSEAIIDRLDELERRYALELDIVVNDHAIDRNNAYSLWCARDLIAGGVLLCNGDTLHPPSVQSRLLDGSDNASHVRLAIDDVKMLGDEEMKVILGNDGSLRRISKGLPHNSDGEYIGVALIPSSAADALIDSLERTWRGDGDQFYEAAFQDLADRGTTVETRSIGEINWIEIDSLDDLTRANGLVCPF